MNYLFFKKITKVNIHLITQLIMSIKHPMKRCRSPPSSGEPLIRHRHIWIFPHGVRGPSVGGRRAGSTRKPACVSRQAPGPAHRHAPGPDASHPGPPLEAVPMGSRLLSPFLSALPSSPKHRTFSTVAKVLPTQIQ